MSETIASYCRITNNSVTVNGKTWNVAAGEGSWLTNIYHSLEISYPKFFKMDNLAKCGFLGAELALRDIDFDKTVIKEDVSVVCCNRSSSLDDDSEYQKTIQHADNYFPSPAVFVYTLANIVTGEIAIRNKTMGETSFYVMESFNPQKICSFAKDAFSDPSINSCLCGWVEYFEGNCDVLFLYILRNGNGHIELNTNNLHNLYY